jgi:hypothetical protein
LTAAALRQKITPPLEERVMKIKKGYPMGIRVDNVDRAKDFDTHAFGMEDLGRVAASPNNRDSVPVHGIAQKLDRFRYGNNNVVLFERPIISNECEKSFSSPIFDAAHEGHEGLKGAPLRRARGLKCIAVEFRISEICTSCANYERYRKEHEDQHNHPKPPCPSCLRGEHSGSFRTKTLGPQHGQAYKTDHRRDIQTRRHRQHRRAHLF